jgi:hypothetical protein
MASHLAYDMLSRLVERRATPVEEARAQRHLASCGRCRSELAWLERIRSLPQYGFGGVQGTAAVDSHGDGWGNSHFGQPRGGTNRDPQAPGQGGPADEGPRSVAAHWLRPGSPALLR